MVPSLEEVVRAIRPHLPLTIHEVNFENGVNLTIGGEGWSLTVNAPWRITRAGQLLLGSEEDAARPWPSDLVTQRILAVEPQGIGGLDLAFLLDGGKVLEVFSCHPVEPWVLRLPTAPVWVSSPSAKGAL